MKYERLTDKDWHNEKFYAHRDSERRILKRLWDLENKIEQGLMIELPCKVGDTVYWVFTTNIQQEMYECYVTEFIYNNKGLDICLSKKCLNGYAYFTLKDIGKTVFLTREDAEKKLKELQE